MRNRSLTETSQLGGATAACFLACCLFPKLALLAFYYRLSPDRWFRASIYVYAVAVTVTNILVMILSQVLVGCPAGECLERLSSSQAILNVVGDVVLIVMPIPIIFVLKLPLRQRIVVYTILAIGSGQVLTPTSI